MNTRDEWLAGSENGPVVKPHKAEASRLLAVVTSSDSDERMPPKGDPLSAAQIEVLRRWVDAGLPWDEGFAFQKPPWEPPLQPRRPELPAAHGDRSHPVDRLLDAWMAERRIEATAPLGDEAFLRRVTMDITGLLPSTEARAAFLKDASPGKRSALIDALLADREAYAGHWMTFWNDLLRNDYAGTGYIDGGRRQITSWLYRALLENKPYDVFTRELIAPTGDSEGFSRGIKWRGVVSAGQTVPIQFAQSVGQVFLGINLKCASCHDSFIDRWKLSDAYGLAAVFAEEPLELHRCDVATGKMASPAWLFPEMGTIDAAKPRTERLQQLAGLMTHPDNGRFSRTMVNRLWHRLMGTGIVHPVDAMQSPPWHADLLDWLASEFVAMNYDLQKMIRLICTSQAYQAKAVALRDGEGPEWRGPRARRMTAEQFVDAVWQITGTNPGRIDAEVPRDAAKGSATAQWVWSHDGMTRPHAAGDAIALRYRFTLAEEPTSATGVVTCDNEFVLYVNGQKTASGDNWETPVSLDTAPWRKGENTILAVARNGGSGPNPAGFYFAAKLGQGNAQQQFLSGQGWEWTTELPDASGRWTQPPRTWQPVVPYGRQETWNRLSSRLAEIMNGNGGLRARASLMKSDFLMRALGRPNREQIVSTRPAELTTLEAMDLNNGPILNDLLGRGAAKILESRPGSSADLANWLYTASLCRKPSPDELAVALEMLGPKPDAAGLQDLLWAIFMLPEFQLVR